MNPQPPELSDAEKARYRAARSAGEDLQAAITSGDDDERRAAARQLFQAVSKLDPAATLDKIHLPEDAGDFAVPLRAIMGRIPDGWGRWISCRAGWYPLIVALDRRLAALDPNYVVLQCKEKFGRLRYYVRSERPEVRSAFDELIRAAESRSVQTCELCGAAGCLHVSEVGWLRTACPSCAAATGLGRVGELVEELSAQMRGLWQVRAEDGDHFWDLNRGRYTPPSGGPAEPIAAVAAWPRVGHSFRVQVVTEPAENAPARLWRVGGVVATIARIR